MSSENLMKATIRLAPGSTVEIVDPNGTLFKVTIDKISSIPLLGGSVTLTVEQVRPAKIPLIGRMVDSLELDWDGEIG